MAGESGLGSPAVEYTLVGVADDELFARAELLAELLSRSLPNFAMKKVVVSQERWAGNDHPPTNLLSSRSSYPPPQPLPSLLFDTIILIFWR
jgi:hypothetical protein